jgi:hypothetical protein
VSGWAAEQPPERRRECQTASLRRFGSTGIVGPLSIVGQNACYPHASTAARELHAFEDMKFALRNVGKGRKDATHQTYDSLEDARAALREMLGWPDVQLGPGYTTPTTDSQIWCAYRTRAEAEADPDGLNTPRIVRLSTTVSTTLDSTS